MPKQSSGQQPNQSGMQDFLFEALVGMPRMDLINQVINDPNNQYAQQMPDLDKQEHAVASQKIAERWGPMLSFIAGLGQEAGTGLVTGAKAAGKTLIPTQPSDVSGVIGPQGFDPNDLIANMYGIQSAMGGGAPSFGEALLRRLQQFGQSFGGRRGPGERTGPAGSTVPRG